jgi:predicted 2-oxoglutarate/Fe(II)-dependent dioxygenase YbiX
MQAACEAAVHALPPPVLFTDGASAEVDLSAFRDMCAADELDYHARLSMQLPIGLAGAEGRQRVESSTSGVFSQSLSCLRPAGGSWIGRHDPLALPLTVGRVCSHELCSLDKCALHVRDGVVSADEAAQLRAHGREVLEGYDGASGRPASQSLPPLRSRRVDFLESARHGSAGGHLLSLRIAERMRRIAARAFSLPVEAVAVSEHFLTVRQRGPSLEPPVHCDEAVFPHGEGAKSRWRFHFSSVLWLGEAGSDFDGGELAFYNNSTRPWLEVAPAVGRAAIFSSGWENVHGIRPVTRGERWAFTAAFMVHGRQTGDTARRGRDFRARCVRPEGKGAYAECRQHWAAAML